MANRPKSLFELAESEAMALGFDHIGPEHWLLGIAASGGKAAQLLAACGATLENLRCAVRELYEPKPTDDVPRQLPMNMDVFFRGITCARRMRQKKVTVEHALLALITDERRPTRHILAQVKADFARLEREIWGTFH